MVGSSGGYLAPTFIPLAHRGGSHLPKNLGIENTLRAFRNATDLGFTYLETDVHATADHQLIAFHDEELGRVTDAQGRPGDFTLAELKQLRVGDREEIPSLDELFETLPDARFNIDIKQGRATELLARTIQRHAAEERVCVASFDVGRIRRFRKLMPGVATAASPLAAAGLVARKVWTRLGDVYQVPIEHRLAGKRWKLVTRESVDAIHAAGKKVHVWTINDDVVMHRLIDWGVDGIVTDRPDLLKAVLHMRGMWSTR